MVCFNVKGSIRYIIWDRNNPGDPCPDMHPDQDFLYRWPGQLHRVGCDDPDGTDQHWRYSFLEIQSVPLVYVIQDGIQWNHY